MTDLTKLQAARLAALQQSYPRWHLAYDSDLRCWIATGHASPDQREYAAGIRQYIIRFSPERLGARLSEYVETLHRLRGSSHNFTSLHP